MRTQTHDDVTKWKHFPPRNWPFVRGIHRRPVNSPHKGQWRRALMFSLICAWINAWVNNREAGDLRRNRAHYDVIAMTWRFTERSFNERGFTEFKLLDENRFQHHNLINISLLPMLDDIMDMPHICIRLWIYQTSYELYKQCKCWCIYGRYQLTLLCRHNGRVGVSKFLAQKASNAENVPIWWRHHVWA